MHHENNITIPTQLAAIAKIPLADDRFAAACNLIMAYKAIYHSPDQVVEDLRVIADFIEGIY